MCSVFSGRAPTALPTKLTEKLVATSARAPREQARGKGLKNTRYSRYRRKLGSLGLILSSANASEIFRAKKRYSSPISRDFRSDFIRGEEHPGMHLLTSRITPLAC